MSFKNYFVSNLENIIGILIAYFSLILPIYKFLQDKRKEERNKRFENYHKLIDDLVGGCGSLPMLDRQIAIIYEFRHFKEYYPVTLRILRGLKETWSTTTNIRILNEISLTEQYIESNWFCRKIYFRKK